MSKTSYAILLVAAALMLNDHDAPDVSPIPKEGKVESLKNRFMATVYSRTLFNSIERVKEAYFDTAQACAKHLESNLRNTDGDVDYVGFDTGNCMDTLTGQTTSTAKYQSGKIVIGKSPIEGEMTDVAIEPHVATVNLKSLSGDYQWYQNIRIRYFNSAAACKAYTLSHLQEMEAPLDVNAWDSATCHSATTGKLVERLGNGFWQGRIKSEPPEENPVYPPAAKDTEVPYVGTLYLRTIFGTVEREKIAYFQSGEACARYMLDSLIEAKSFWDFNAHDQATCIAQGSSERPNFRAQTGWTSPPSFSWE